MAFTAALVLDMFTAFFETHSSLYPRRSDFGGALLAD